MTRCGAAFLLPPSATNHIQSKKIVCKAVYVMILIISSVVEQMEMEVLRDMVLGKPSPLVSTFRLSYYTILNLMSRAEGQFTAEHVIKNSFHQFQYEKVFLSFHTYVREFLCLLLITRFYL